MKSLLIPMSYTPDQESCAKKAVKLSGPDITVLSYTGGAALSTGGTVPFNGGGFPIINCDSHEQLLSLLAETDEIILVSPDFCTLHNLAIGECSSDLSQCILRALLWGVKVIILVDYEIPRFLRDSFYGKLNDDFDALRSLGITIDTFNVEKRFLKPVDFVTENDVLAAGRLGREAIYCTKKAIVTQLAEDLCKDMNIQIVRNG